MRNHGIKLSPTYDDFHMSYLLQLNLTSNRVDWDGENTYVFYSAQPPKADIEKIKKYATNDDLTISIY